MVRRRGLGATLAATVVFSLILVSGISVYVASQNLAALASKADSENFLWNEFGVLEGAGGINMLIGLQRFVASSSLPCNGPEATVSSALGNIADRQSATGLKVTSSMSLAPGVSLSDNLSSLRPYNGSVPGDLDVMLIFEGNGTAGPDIGFGRNEVHYAHLPVQVGAASSICMGSIHSIEGVLARSNLPNCTAAGAAQTMRDATRGPRLLSDRLGYIFSYTFSARGGESCSVGFTVFIAQPRIEGPGGQFTARFEEDGSATVETLA